MPPSALLYPKTRPAEFVCSVCHHRQPVEFRDPTAFAEDEPFIEQNEWAQKAALESAQRKLDKAAGKALMLVSCPSCGATDVRALRRAYGRAALPLLAIAPASLMVSIIVLVLMWPGPRPPMLGPVLGGTLFTLAFGAFVTVYNHRRLLKEAKQSLRFLPAAGA